ncbi:TIGR03986 family type III CRISPR-associated RAMP protein [Salinarimonas sp. NSM]|uniref:TIGR03986 family type III CRISPR-associated RAMP protein n=1 Tax=Salinarimonas sp. NSM TaxID=3458003 RepID=UPI004035251F
MKRRDPIHAPYNFVPLPDRVCLPDWHDAVSQDVPLADGFSGVVNFTLLALTPLIVGGERTKQDDGITVVDFVRAPEGEREYLPGSTLKGMVRAVVEIASFGRFHPVANRRFAIRDLTPAGGKEYRDFVRRVNAGWLRYDAADGWTIERCKYARIATSSLGITNLGDEKWKQAPSKHRDVAKRWKQDEHALTAWVRDKTASTDPDRHVVELCDEDDPNAREVTIVLTGQPSGSKKLDFVFYDDSGKRVPVRTEIMEKFRDVHEDRDKASDPVGRGVFQDNESSWEFWRGAHRIPVFYVTDGSGVAALGLARMFRYPGRATVHELRRNSGQRAHERRARPDLAELIFGRIDEEAPAAGDRSGALRGRVAFGHAMKIGNAEAERQPPGILSQPKASFYPAYLEQADAGDGRLGSVAYATYMNSDARLRGWKRYPVRQPDTAKVQMLEGLEDKVSQQSILRTLPAGTRFRGRLRVHNLHRIELGALLWAMTFGGRESCAHAVGMGKPFGFGQIRFELDDRALASGLRANDGRAVPSSAELRAAFEAYMVREAGPRWQGGETIAMLLRMATPGATKAHPDGAHGLAGPLTYMPLDAFRARRGGDENEAMILRAYKKPPENMPAPGTRFRNGTAVTVSGDEAVLQQDLTDEHIAQDRPVEVTFFGKPAKVVPSAIAEVQKLRRKPQPPAPNRPRP